MILNAFHVIRPKNGIPPPVDPKQNPKISKNPKKLKCSRMWDHCPPARPRDRSSGESRGRASPPGRKGREDMSIGTLGPCIIGPYIIRPYMIEPYIIGPYIIGPYVIGPYIVVPYIIVPYIIVPYM